MFRVFHQNALGSTEAVDIIEAIVYEWLKPMGFRKHGRTLHRFVEDDISQVIHFQNGCAAKGVTGILWVNLGIRIPECEERTFSPAQPQKKYYHEYECNIRNRLGNLVDHQDTHYSLKKPPERIAQDILNRLQKYVLPVFDTINSRDTILAQKEQYANFDESNILLTKLDEAMVFGRRGDIIRACELFHAYYRETWAEYCRDRDTPKKHYLKKGQRIVYSNAKTGQAETIIAEKSGYVTLYSANKGHLQYLGELAQNLGIALPEISAEN